MRVLEGNEGPFVISHSRILTPERKGRGSIFSTKTNISRTERAGKRIGTEIGHKSLIEGTKGSPK